MKSVIASFAVAVLAGLVNAKAQFTNTEFDVEAGESFTLTWTGGVGPYQILLKDGPSTNLQTVDTLVSSTTDESATITLPSSLTTGTYAFEIVDASDSESNYSSQFSFVGSAATTSASSTKIASSTAASSSSPASSSSASASATTVTTASASTTASTTGSSSTLATTTTSSSSTRTSSSASSTSTVANTNDGRGLVAPFLAPLIFAAVAAF